MAARPTAALAPLLLLALLAITTTTPASAIEALPKDVEARADVALAQARNNPQKTVGCGTAPLVVVFGSTPPSSLAALVEDQPPLPRLPLLGSGADVELYAAGDTSACLASVTRVRGTVLIYDDGTLPSSLSVLSNLQRVDESLIVYGSSQSSALTSLSFLSSLQACGNLAIARLPRLSSVSGLQNLRTINGELTLWRLPELQTLDDMGPISAVQGRLWIELTPKLLSLGRLPPLPPVTPAALATKITKQQGDAPATPSAASGLSTLRTVSLDLHIEKTDLPSLELPFLTTVGGEVALLHNRRLASTQGLRSLNSAFGVALINNDLLADVDGFARLTELKGDLQVVRNKVIQSVNGFSRIGAVGLTVDVSSNPILRSLDGLTALKTIGQTLNVAFNPSLETLRGFGSLTTVGGDLIVRNNTQLKELTDLGAALTAVGTGPAGGSLIIEGNEALASLAPLASPPLQVVRGSVRVRAGNGFAGGPQATGLEALAQPGFEMAVPGVTTTPAAATVAPVAPVAPVAATPATPTPITTTTPAVAVAPSTPRAVAPPMPMAVPAPAAAVPPPPAAPAVGSDTFVNTLLSG